MFTTSKLVHEFRTPLNEMTLHWNISLQWVSGHGACLGNNLIDELARKDTNLSAGHTDHFCETPLSACKQKDENI